MKNLFCKNKYLILLFLSVSLLSNSCQTKGYTNFTTYFNTFYNAERLMKEAEEEFEFQKEKKRITPKVIAPQTNIPEIDENKDMPPTFLSNIIVSKATRQSVEVKLDSILIKGSKILAKSAKSDYVEPTLFLMAKTYFYKEEWIPAQIKCSELIDLNPTGDLSPDAHLLMSFALLLQKKYLAGKTMLSRTIDVAWLKNRYDILTKAFNMEAEMALLDNDLEDAIRPYFQAIAQSDNNKLRALWQCEMANILFRMGKFKRAKKAYANVMNFSPDYVTEYTSKVYYASCLIRLEEYEKAEKILRKLDNDGKFTEWRDYVISQRMLSARLSKDTTALSNLEHQADSTYPASQAKCAYYFEKGIDEFKNSEYIKARKYMALARNTPIQIARSAKKLFDFLNGWELALKTINMNKMLIEKEEINRKLQAEAQDSLKNKNLPKKIKNEAKKTQDNITKTEQNKNNQIQKSSKEQKNINANNKENTNLQSKKLKISKTITNKSLKTNNTIALKNTDKSLKTNNTIALKNANKTKKQKFIKFNTDPTLDLNERQDTITINSKDILKVEMAGAYFSLARLHHNIGNIDSANYYYHKAAMEAPISSEESARYLYVYSKSIRDTNQRKADSILDLIVVTQPKTEHGRAAMSELGYTAAFIPDTAASLYNSGFDLMKHKEYDFAIKQFKKVFTKYPNNHNYAPKSLYSIGFIFEQKLSQYDSAYYYYQKLIKQYPNSIYAKELQLPVKYLSIVKNGEPIPEELKDRKFEIYHANREVLNAPIDSTLLLTPKKEEDEGFGWGDLKNPSKLFKKAKKGLQNQINKLKDVESMKKQLLEKVSPDKLAPKLEDFIPGEKIEQDTTNTNKPLPKNSSEPPKK